MVPMLPFLAGLALGALSVSAVRSGRASQSLHQVGDRVRAAARSGGAQLQTVAAAGKAMTQRVWDGVAATQAEATAPAPAEAATAPPKRRRTATRGAAAPATTPAKRAPAKRAPAKRASKKAAE